MYKGNAFSKVVLKFLKKVDVNVEEQSLTLFLESPNYIDQEIIEDLENHIRENISGLEKLDINIEYPKDGSWFENNMDFIWKDFCNSINKEIPSCSNWIRQSKQVCEGNTLNLEFNNIMVQELYKSNNLDDLFKEWALTNLKLPIKVEFKTDDKDIDRYKSEYILKKEAEDSSIIKNTVVNNIERSGAKAKDSNFVVLGRAIKGPAIPIEDLREDSGRVVVKAEIFDIDVRETRNGKIILSIDVTDYSSSVTLKYFCDKNTNSHIQRNISEKKWIVARGDCMYDRYARDLVIDLRDLMIIDSEDRKDRSKEKRVELHAHSQMSAMDGLTDVEALIERASKWGHKAIAITDHGVLQAFPKASRAGNKFGIKVIYGLEAYMVNDSSPIVINDNRDNLDQTVIVLDIETTGLDPYNDGITEIGAVKVENKTVVDSFHTFVNPEKPIPEKIKELTGIDDEMVQDAPLTASALASLKDFCGEYALAAHNASFDFSFLKIKGASIDWNIQNPIIDTLALARELLPELRRFRLDQIAKHMGISLSNHHRASDDAKATADILINFFNILENQGINSLKAINDAYAQRTNINSLPVSHATIYARNNIGLRNLYELVSKSHLEYFYRWPRLPKTLIQAHREGLIIGSACTSGELYEGIINGLSEDELEEIIEFYDFLEIQSLENNHYLIERGLVKDVYELMEINRRIYSLGKKFDKRVVATGDVHYLEPQDQYLRTILLSGQGYKDISQEGSLYFKTTDEMLKDFNYLGEEEAYEVVVEASNEISRLMDNIQPIPDGLFTPSIEGADEDIKDMALSNAIKIYGPILPPVVKQRLDKELGSIIEHGFAVLYLISHRLVNKSLEDGYLVGSRGSVGSSFVAYLTDITEVNPLPPHYVCPACSYSDFDIDKQKYGEGVDLPNKNCPDCNTPMNKDGFDIPFEVFLGFKGDKVPDIDLNFSGEYQAVAHDYTEKLFGEGYVFRAGTISTIANKTAYGFVRKYLEENDILVSNAEIKRLTQGLTGIKRTTGQHPGGIMVVPKGREIYEFTPIQYPADDRDSKVITTHFDYNFIHDNLVKLDILGHDDPTMLRILEDMTGIDPQSIPLDDSKTMSIFSNTEGIGLNSRQLNSKVGTFGIPEFGTRFVRQMLIDTLPTSFGELIRISGLSHGTDVWLNNAQNLIRDGVAQLSEVISTRDDIMTYLIYRGIDPIISFQIMENVRRGRGVTEEEEKIMVSKDVPKWFIDSCKKIKYMFPKAHAAAYVLMAFRIAYFKVHHPLAFYTAYFTLKSDDFDADITLLDRGEIVRRIDDLDKKGNMATVKERSLLTILEIVNEMYLRGFEFSNIDIYLSHPTRFLLIDGAIRPPLNTIQGVGNNAALSIYEARKDGEFISIEDLRERTRITKTAIETLRKHGAVSGMSETSQLSLF